MKYTMNLQKPIKQIFISAFENPLWKKELKNKFNDQVQERLSDELYVKLSNELYWRLYREILTYNS
jgi:hypothetical protein